MGNEEKRIIKELIQKEEQLLENTIRNDAKEIAQLVDDNCIEFTESGEQHSHRPGEKLGTLDGVLYIDDTSARLIDLAEDCRLLLYVATRVKKNTRTKSNCSSIWKKINGQWKVVFHQRTACV